MEKTITFFPDFYESIKFLPDEQFGAAMRAAMEYQLTGKEYAGEDAAVRMAFNFAKSQTERKREYSEKKKSAANAKWGKRDNPGSKVCADADNPDSPPCEEIQTCAQECKDMQSDSDPCTIMQDDAERCEGVQGDAPYPYPSPYPYKDLYSPAAAENQPRKTYGQYGWVKLTEGEHRALVNDLGGDELERCIAYVDKSAQKTGNKNRWKDWDLVLRDCHKERWGLKRGGRHGPEKKGEIHGCGELGPAELEAIAMALKQPPDDFGGETQAV